MKEPYQGSGKYIFVSYAHKDSRIAYPFIEALQERYNVWYDKGIHFANEWDKEVADHLARASLFIFLVSDNSLKSENCLDEINQAKNRKIPFINALLEDVHFSMEFELRYSRFQMCKVFEYHSLQDAIEDISRRTENIHQVLADSSLDYGDEYGIRPIKHIFSVDEYVRVMNLDCDKHLDLSFSRDDLKKEIFDSLSESGNDPYLLGTCYYFGIGTEVNIFQAFHLFGQALSNSKPLNENALSLALCIYDNLANEEIPSTIEDYAFDQVRLPRKGRYPGFDLFHRLSPFSAVLHKILRHEIRSLDDGLLDGLSEEDRRIAQAAFAERVKGNKEEARERYLEAMKLGSESAYTSLKRMTMEMPEYFRFMIGRGYLFKINPYYWNCRKEGIEDPSMNALLLRLARYGYQQDAVLIVLDKYLKGEYENELNDEEMLRILENGVDKGSVYLAEVYAEAGRRMGKLKYRKGIKRVKAKEKALLELLPKAENLFQTLLSE